MNARLEPKKDPKVLAIEAKLKDPISINMDKQPLSEAITFLQNYTGLNIVLDPKALGDEGHDLGLAGDPGRQPDSAQDRAQAHAQAARADLQGRGRGAPDHQPAGDPGADVSPRPTTSATWSCRRIKAPQNLLPHAMIRPTEQHAAETDANGIANQGHVRAGDPTVRPGLQRRRQRQGRTARRST